MSDRKNLYKMDDIFIFLSYFLIVPVVFMLLPWLIQLPNLMAEGAGPAMMAAWSILGTRLIMAGGYLLAAILMQIIGRTVRKKENRCLDILDILQYSRKSTVPIMANQLGLSEDRTYTLISGLSAMSSLGVELNGNDVELVDPARKAFTEPVEAEPVEAEEEKPEEVPPKDLKDLFRDIKEMQKSGSSKNFEDVEAMQSDLKEKFAAARSGTKGKPPFNIVLFAILMMTPLWPVALIYAGRRIYKQSKAGKQA